MKKLIVFLCIAALLVSGTVFPSSAFISEAEVVEDLGDANADGEINAKDIYFLKMLTKGYPVDAHALQSDINGDGDINARDSYYMALYLSGAIGTFGIEGKDIARISIDNVDISAFEIVIPADDSLKNENLEYAAEELSTYIERACGVLLPIVTEPTGDNAFYFSLDSTDSSGELSDEGFDIKVENGNVYIKGGTRRGCLYATYEFLEKYIGFVFISIEHEYLYKNDAINIYTGDDYRFIPPMKLRDCQTTSYSTEIGGSAKDILDISTKVRINSSKGLGAIERSEKYGYGLGEINGGAHTIGNYTYCPNSEYICYSNKEIIAEVTENVLKKAEERRESLDWAPNNKCGTISVSPMDNPLCCTCRNCGKLTRTEESYMGAQLTFVNKIADAVSQVYGDDIKIYTTAYWYARKPPKTVTPADNVIIHYTWQACNNHPFDGSACYEEGNAMWYNNIKEGEYLKKWTEICDEVYIWVYVGSYSIKYAHPSVLDHILDNARYFADLGIAGVYYEGEYGYDLNFCDGWGFDLLQMWLMAKCSWDPYMTDEEYDMYYNEFLLWYYGPGYESVRKYLDINTAATDATGACWVNNFDMPFTCIDMDYLGEHSEEAIEAMERALSLSVTESETENCEKLLACVLWQCLSATYSSSYENGNESDRAVYAERYVRMYELMEKHGMFDPAINTPNIPDSADEIVDPYSWTPWEVYHHNRLATDPMDYAN